MAGLSLWWAPTVLSLLTFQEIDAKDTAAINLLRSESCKPNELASKLPDKSPAYVFYSFPTPPPPKPAAPAASPAAQARNVFQATAGGARPVAASNAPRIDEEDKDDEDKEGKEDKEGEESEEPSASAGAEETEGDAKKEDESNEEKTADDATPDITGLNISEEPAASPEAVRSPSPEAPSKGRVVFIYWCPSGSPVKYRMVYSTTVRGIQQDAMDKVGIEVVGKLETSDKTDLTESAIREVVPNKPKSSSSLPPGGAPRMFGAPAPPGRFGSPASGTPPAASPSRMSSSNPTSPPVFGAPATFGAPRPIRTGSSLSTGSGGSAAASPATGNNDDDESDSSARIQSAFNAFGPRVGGGGGGSFARPRPAGRR